MSEKFSEKTKGGKQKVTPVFAKDEMLEKLEISKQNTHEYNNFDLVWNHIRNLLLQNKIETATFTADLTGKPDEYTLSIYFKSPTLKVSEKFLDIFKTATKIEGISLIDTNNKVTEYAENVSKKILEAILSPEKSEETGSLIIRDGEEISKNKLPRHKILWNKTSDTAWQILINSSDDKGTSKPEFWGKKHDMGFRYVDGKGYVLNVKNLDDYRDLIAAIDSETVKTPMVGRNSFIKSHGINIRDTVKVDKVLEELKHQDRKQFVQGWEDNKPSLFFAKNLEKTIESQLMKMGVKFSVNTVPQTPNLRK